MRAAGPLYTDLLDTAVISMLADNLLLKPGHLLRVATQRAMAIFAELAGPAGLTPAQWIVLEAVRERPNVPLSIISEMISLNKATVGAVVGRLVERNLLTVGQLAGDRRTKTASVTKDGEAMSRYMAPVVEETQRTLLAPLSEEERTGFLVGIRKMIGAPGLAIEQAAMVPPTTVPIVGSMGLDDGLIAVVGVGQAVGRATAVNFAAQHRPLTLVARNGSQAQDLANMLRVSGFRRINSGSCVSTIEGSQSDGAAGPALRAIAGASVVVFSGWGEPADPSGSLAADIEALDYILQILAATGGLCIIVSALAHTAALLDSRWLARGVRVAGVDPDSCSAKIAARFVSTLAEMGAVAGGTVIAPRSNSASRTN